MHFVYAIYNRKHNKIYIGEAEDVNERLRAHNDHRFASSYTAHFDGQWELVYRERCATRKEARVREKQLKSYRGRQFIRKNIRG